MIIAQSSPTFRIATNASRNTSIFRTIFMRLLLIFCFANNFALVSNIAVVAFSSAFLLDALTLAREMILPLAVESKDAITIQ